MEYEHKDPESGKVKKYEISYSQQMQSKIEKAIRLSNYLKIILLVGLVVSIILALLIVTDSGVIGYIIRRGVCATCGL